MTLYQKTQVVMGMSWLRTTSSVRFEEQEVLQARVMAACLCSRLHSNGGVIVTHWSSGAVGHWMLLAGEPNLSFTSSSIQSHQCGVEQADNLLQGCVGDLPGQPETWRMLWVARLSTTSHCFVCLPPASAWHAETLAEAFEHRLLRVGQNVLRPFAWLYQVHSWSLDNLLPMNLSAQIKTYQNWLHFGMRHTLLSSGYVALFCLATSFSMPTLPVIFKKQQAYLNLKALGVPN